MKKVLLLLIVGVIIIAVYWGVQASIERSRMPVVTIDDLQKQEGIPVVVTTAATRTLKSILTYTGSIRGIEQTDVTSVIMEKVLTIHVTPGQTINQGIRLITLDNRNTAVFRQVSEALADAQQDYKRTRELFKAGAVSQQMLDKAELQKKVAQAEYDAMIWRHGVTSPISGIVTDIFVEKGQTVAPGTPLARVAKLDKVISEIQVAETDIANIKNGQAAAIHSRSYPDREFTGTVKEIALSTNPSARNFTIEIEISNQNLLLKPGMFVSVDLTIREVNNVVAIQKDALIKDNGSFYVYTVQQDMTVTTVNVDPQLTEGEWIEIPDGISPGDKIVLEGHNKLTAGSKVIVVPTK